MSPDRVLNLPSELTILPELSTSDIGQSIRLTPLLAVQAGRDQQGKPHSLERPLETACPRHATE